MIPKGEYVLVKVEAHVDHRIEANKPIQPLILKELIAQWKFDYEIEKEYRPEVLQYKNENNNPHEELISDVQGKELL